MLSESEDSWRTLGQSEPHKIQGLEQEIAGDVLSTGSEAQITLGFKGGAKDSERDGVLEKKFGKLRKGQTSRTLNEYCLEVWNSSGRC